MNAVTAEREAVADDDVLEAGYYVKYAFAAYGYLLYVVSQPIYMCAHCQPFHSSCLLASLNPGFGEDILVQEMLHCHRTQCRIVHSLRSMQNVELKCYIASPAHKL